MMDHDKVQYRRKKIHPDPLGSNNLNNSILKMLQELNFTYSQDKH